MRITTPTEKDKEKTPEPKSAKITLGRGIVNKSKGCYQVSVVV
jgi:hypothetical protein